VQRQLSTTPQTATSWQWSFRRRPVASAGQLSATNIANPTFTPDVNDLYELQVVATGASAASITTVSLTPGCAAVPPTPIPSSNVNPSCPEQPVTLDAGAGYDYHAWSSGGPTTRTIVVAPNSTTTYDVIGYVGSCPSSMGSIVQNVTAAAPPTNTTATAASATSIQVSWTPTEGAVSYEVWRSNNNQPYALIATPTGTPINDAVSANTTYLYKVKAVYSACTSIFSKPSPTIRSSRRARPSGPCISRSCALR
jgi:hypothetical protein